MPCPNTMDSFHSDTPLRHNLLNALGVEILSSKYLIVRKRNLEGIQLKGTSRLSKLGTFYVM